MDIDELTRRIGAAAEAPDFGPERVRVILTDALATQDDWLTGALQHRDPDVDWVLYPVYRAPDRRASLLVAVFSSGAVSPAHDHGTWAVVGIYRGREREIRYRRRGECLEVERTLVNPRGAISIVPSDAIHSVEALDGCDAVSIHVYGTDIVTQRRSSFDPATGEETIFTPDFTTSDG
ncbi:MAG TPA: cysteine dioxygenase [Aldersonia sp.]